MKELIELYKLHIKPDANGSDIHLFFSTHFLSGIVVKNPIPDVAEREAHARTVAIQNCREYIIKNSILDVNSSETIHSVLRLYGNGGHVINGVKATNLRSHLLYNKQYRPGCSLFVDNKCIYSGNHTDKEIEEFEAEMDSMKDTLKYVVSNDTTPYL